MQSLRGNLANIPSALSNFISNTTTTPIEGSSQVTVHSPPPYSEMHSSTASTSDDYSEISQAIPSTLIKEQWQVILGQDASIADLTNAIERCKELVVKTDELSSERKWLVRHLVELRFRLSEIEDMVNDPCKTGSNIRVVLGHHFVDRNIKSTPRSRQHCDHCTGVIWSVVQASYICADCNFCVHHKCIQSIARVCAHIVASENKVPNPDICPEFGLAAQGYKCAECHSSLSFNMPGPFYYFGSQYRSSALKNRTDNNARIFPTKELGHVEPRICDYSGQYYCPTCHWNDVIPIPARIIHNWDFSRQKACRASLQVLAIMNDRPVIDLEQRNPKLFIYVQNLSLVKKLRTNLNDMRRYLCECRLASTSKILENAIGNKRHLIQNVNMYSIGDLIDVENGTIVEFLNKVFATFEQHIRKCELCAGKGYVCEICRNVEVLFPFDDGAVNCKVCSTVFHRACWLRKNQKCPKCARVELRKSQLLEQPEEDAESKQS